MGAHTIHFKCHHCRHCCKDVVCLPTPMDVIQIVKATGLDPHAFLEFLRPSEIREVGRDDATWLRCRQKKYIMAIRRDEKGCYFLNKKTALCDIYESRPILCRLFPFKLHETRQGDFKAFSLHTKVECPRHLDGVVEARPLYDAYVVDRGHQDDYHDLVTVFNRRGYDKPEDFIPFAIRG